MGYIGLTKMPGFRPLSVLLFYILPSAAATFGTPVDTFPAADLVLDGARNRLYVLEPTAVPPRIEIYNVAVKAGATPILVGRIGVDAAPSAMAMSRSGQYLYVACYGASALDVIDLNKRPRSTPSGLGANPWAVAVGYNEKVLISTIGGTGESCWPFTIPPPVRRML